MKPPRASTDLKAPLHAHAEGGSPSHEHRAHSAQNRELSRAGTPVGGALFEGFFLAGFECSDHVLENGKRLDLLESTAHDRFAHLDYARMRKLGMTACREGASWVRCEPSPHRYDFRSLLPRLHAGRQQGVQIVWDLMHFGWPEGIDVFAPSFPTRFARFAGALARFFSNETDQLPMFTPINEMSFLAWAGGDVRCLNPFEAARGVELKAQLVLATIEAIEAIEAVIPHARFVSTEPVINIVPDPDEPKTWRRVEADNELQFQAWDMLTGKVWPRLGGKPKYLDILGVNFYPDNQFMLDGTTIRRGDPRYKAFSRILHEVFERYARPMFVSETGSEGDERAAWLRYVADECTLALRAGCELHGITLYPVLNHPGWVDDRRCQNGLWDYADEHGQRALYEPLAEELSYQAPRLSCERAEMLRRTVHLRLPA